jgi:hypothetical protein
MGTDLAAKDHSHRLWEDVPGAGLEAIPKEGPSQNRRVYLDPFVPLFRFVFCAPTLYLYRPSCRCN